MPRFRDHRHRPYHYQPLEQYQPPPVTGSVIRGAIIGGLIGLAVWAVVAYTAARWFA